MSDLDEIAAAAGITIVDTHAANDENTDNVNESSSDNSCLTKQIHEWDDMFSNRYTMSDTEYATTVETADILNRPPCLTGFNCFRQRDDSRNWNRDGRHNDGDRGRYRGNSWNRHGRNDGGGWNRDRDDGRSHHNLQSHGDYHHRGYENQQSSGDHRRSDSYQNRGDNRNYQNRGNYYDQDARNDSGDHQHRRYEK